MIYLIKKIPEFGKYFLRLDVIKGWLYIFMFFYLEKGQ